MQIRLISAVMGSTIMPSCLDLLCSVFYAKMASPYHTLRQLMTEPLIVWQSRSVLLVTCLPLPWWMPCLSVFGGALWHTSPRARGGGLRGENTITFVTRIQFSAYRMSVISFPNIRRILQRGLGDTVSFPLYIVFLPTSDPPIVTKYISTRAAPSQRPNHPLGRTPRVIEARFSWSRSNAMLVLLLQENTVTFTTFTWRSPR